MPSILCSANAVIVMNGLQPTYPGISDASLTYPIRRFQALRHWDEAPQLPTGYTTMMLLALAPPRWRQAINWRVLDHYGGDVSLTALAPAASRGTCP
jgi:hypothetical protein